MASSFAIQHTTVDGSRPHWYRLDSAKDFNSACRRARDYALDHGGYVCVTDETGKTVFGTDPDQLAHAIALGINRDFPREARAS